MKIASGECPVVDRRDLSFGKVRGGLLAYAFIFMCQNGKQYRQAVKDLAVMI